MDNFKKRPSKEEESIAFDLQRLAQLADSNNQPFIYSLAWHVTRAGRAWSDKQLYWAKHYHDALLKKEVEKNKNLDEAKKQAAMLQASASFPNILALFNKAQKAGLAYPKISYNLPDCLLVLAYSPTYDTISIRVGNRSIGAITQAGKLSTTFPLRDTKVLNCLLSIEKDPIDAAKISGRKTGSCCFCSKELIDPRSVYHSYGPVCATHWGLPWDDLTKEQKESMDARFDPS